MKPSLTAVNEALYTNTAPPRPVLLTPGAEGAASWVKLQLSAVTLGRAVILPTAARVCVCGWRVTDAPVVVDVVVSWAGGRGGAAWQRAGREKRGKQARRARPAARAPATPLSL